MTDAEVKQAIERYKLLVSYGHSGQAWMVVSTPFIVSGKPTLADAVAEVVRQIEERAE